MPLLMQFQNARTRAQNGVDPYQAVGDGLRGTLLDPDRFIKIYEDEYAAGVHTTDRRNLREKMAHQAKKALKRDQPVSVTATTPVFLTNEQADQVAAGQTDLKAINVQNPALQNIPEHILERIPTDQDGSRRCHMVGDKRTHIKGDHIIALDRGASTSNALYYRDPTQGHVVRVPLARIFANGFTETDIDRLAFQLNQRNYGIHTQIKSFSVSSIKDINKHKTNIGLGR